MRYVSQLLSVGSPSALIPKLRGLLLMMIVFCLLDWAVKWADLFTSIPHQTSRSLLILPLYTLLVLAILFMVRSRLTMLGSALLLGGCYANLIDVNMDGVAWNMIPIWSGLYCNVADIEIVLGITTLTVSLIWRLIVLKQNGLLVASA